MKSLTTKFFILAAVIMLLPGVIKAQVKTIEVLGHRDLSSIIREVDDTLWLVCSNDGGGSCRFTKVNENQSIVDQLWIDAMEWIDSIHINDFEIFRDTVYFCGQAWPQDGDPFAMWGYFPLTPFNSGIVYYHPAFAYSFKKLDVFSVDTTTADLHVVMVGTTDAFGQGVIYDEVRLYPNYFNQYISLIFDTIANYSFPDVEVTDRHIAVSTTVDDGSVLFFNKPGLLWNSIFANNVVNCTLPGTGLVQQLEYCGNDILAVASNIPLHEDIHVFIFNGTTLQDHLYIEKTILLNIADLKFDRGTDDLDLLTKDVKYFDNQVDSSVIIHLRQSLAHVGGTADCHKYDLHDLNSLDWLSYKHKIFVASGHDEDHHILHIYKYNYEFWGNEEQCVKKIEKDVEKRDRTTKKEELKIKYGMFNIEMWEKHSVVKQQPLRIICKEELN